MLRRLSTLFLLVAATLQHGLTQQLHNPVSNYGMGDFLDNDQTAVISTGWADQTFYDRYHTNFNNAASYSHLQSTSFEVGINAKNSILSSGNSDYRFWSGQLSHLALAFPVFSPYNELLEKRNKKLHWGMGFALRPYTQVSYNYQFSTEDPAVGKVTNYHSGTGGTYKLYYNNGVSFKNISLGVSAQYIFGKVLRSREISFTDYASYFGNLTSLKNEVYVKGFQFNFSGMYNYILNPTINGKKTDYDKQKRLTIGASFQPMSKLQSSVNSINYVYSSQLGTSVTDTLGSSSTLKSKNKYNAAYGAGLSYQHGAKWQVNINYDAQLFDQYAVTGLEANYKNSGILKIGGEWCPEPNSYSSFFKRSKYRVGFRTGTMPLDLNGEQATVTSAVLGYGFPIFVNRQISHVNIALEGGQKTYGADFKEKYIRVQLGFNLNDDLWFLKRKFD